MAQFYGDLTQLIYGLLSTNPLPLNQQLLYEEETKTNRLVMILLLLVPLLRPQAVQITLEQQIIVQ